MIRYALVCDNGHEFESWFPSGEAYDGQRKTGLVSCPMCDSKNIEKQIMAPSVARTDFDSVPVEQPAARPVTLLSEKERQVRAALKTLHRHLMENAENVGERFPEEARRMHDGETETRSIYGKASMKETRALIEEGIDIVPLPSLPDEQN